MLVIIYVVLSCIFAANITADYEIKNPLVGKVYGFPGTVAVFIIFFLIWPVWLCRIIWNTIFNG